MSATGLPGGSERGLQAVIRALGSLLTALGAPPDLRAPDAGDASDSAARAGADESTPETILDDARRQAYATIDDAAERARAAVGAAGLEGVLARLEQLERRVDAIVERLSRSERGAESVAVAPPLAAPTPVAPPPPVMPATPAVEPSTAPPYEVAAPPINDARSEDPAPDSLTFEPEMGSLVIAVGPISGFQGLMRVQTAIAAVDAVEDVAIEGYARSEATVRTLLSSTLQAERVAEALARELGQAASVRETSTAERRLSIALGEQ